jgi:hypothetical protein
MSTQKFMLTTGEEIVVPMTLNGAEWDWLGQCTFSELGMENTRDDYTHIKCLTLQGDNIARMVELLYSSQAAARRADDSEERDIVGDLWQAFCDAPDLQDFKARVDAIME